MVATIVGAASAGPVHAGRGLQVGYIGAAGLFGLGAVICALAPTIGVLIAGRAVQGWGGGLLLALSYVLVRTIYADRLEVTVTGAPPLLVTLDEVGLRSAGTGSLVSEGGLEPPRP